MNETAQIQEIVIQGDLAVERASYVVQVTPRTGAPFTERGKHIVAYARAPNGEWRIKWEIWNTDTPLIKNEKLCSATGAKDWTRNPSQDRGFD